MFTFGYNTGKFTHAFLRLIFINVTIVRPQIYKQEAAMKDNLRFLTDSLPGLNLLRAKPHAGTCTVYSRMWLIVMLLVVLIAGCNGTNEKLGGGGTTGPAVTSTVPAAGATGVAVDTTITATFSTAMDAATITETTFTLTTGSTAVAGTVVLSTNGLTATFTPDVDLTPDTLYTVTITTGAKDVNGNAIAEKVWTFTTGTGSAPTVLSTVPVDGATGVATTTLITATFSQAMDRTTIVSPATNFTVTDAATTLIVSGIVTLSADNLTATFSPTGGVLAGSTTFIVRITTGVTDIAGNAMASGKVWTFTTGL